jgi:Rps23 Pro-64 3,4-dihydroxylase Tpa1-like proline 4-hydroxylase
MIGAGVGIVAANSSGSQRSSVVSSSTAKRHRKKSHRTKKRKLKTSSVDYKYKQDLVHFAGKMSKMYLKPDSDRDAQYRSYTFEQNANMSVIKQAILADHKVSSHLYKVTIYSKGEKVNSHESAKTYTDKYLTYKISKKK